MRLALATLASTLVAALAGSALAADAKHYSFAYDQPKTTGYGIIGDIFNKKLSELSKGSMVIDQFPGAQLGQEPQALQKIRTGDIDFIITSSANAATVQPESGVFSLHFLFRSEEHLAHALADPGVSSAFKEMMNSKVQGARVLALATLGLRYMYCKTKEIKSADGLKGAKVRVQATKTEDTMFPAYGAQVVHMPFGDVYTSLQTGVVDCAENGINVYASNKHYEVAPIMSLTEHEANNSLIWVSDKLWNSLSAEQKGWVQGAADEVSRTQPAQALKLEHDSQARLEKLGIKFVKGVDKAVFLKMAQPLQDQIATELGPNATKILQLVRAVK